MKILVKFNKNISTPKQVKTFKVFNIGEVISNINDLLNDSIIEIDNETLPIIKLKENDIYKYYLINDLGRTPNLIYPYYTDDFTKIITIDDLIPINSDTQQSISNHSQLILDDGTNPHGTTKSDVGLSNVDNTSDLDKPISTATLLALNNKQDILTANNMGEFMDTVLPIKLTPIAGDTILARDSLTNEAVEIAFSSFNNNSSKRTFICNWVINQSIAASTSWYRQDPQVGIRGNFSTNASLTPTNAFANNIVLTPAFTLPFQAKIKSVTAYGWSNQGGTNVRFCINSSKISTTLGITTPVDCLILADFSVNTQNIQVNGFRHEQTTGLNDATLPALQEIRLFFNNGNANSSIYDGIVTVEFEEVL